MIVSFSDRSILSLALSSGEFLGRSMQAYPENVEGLQEELQIFSPGLLLNNVLDDQVITRFSERRDGAVESVKEALALRWASNGFEPGPETGF